VPASFHLSTNEELRFTDGAVFDTASPTTSALSIAAPEAFGYLSENSGAIEVSGAQLEILNGELGISGNELLVSNGVLVSAEDINIELSGNATVENGGAIATIAIDDLDGGNINLNANDLLIDAQGTGLRTGIFSSVLSGSGGGGAINLSISETATLQGGGEVTSAAEGGEGDAGTIELSATEVLIVDGGSISSLTGFGGDSGDILLTADQLFVNGLGSSDASTGIFNAVAPGSTGDAGNLQISIAETATLQNGGLINSLTFTESNAADLTLNAKQIILEGVSNAGIQSSLGSLTAAGATGDAGRINIFIDDFTIIRDGGLIITSTVSEGNAGNIQLTTNQLLIDGQVSGTLTGISSGALSVSTGNAGMIDVSVGDLATLQNDAAITVRTTSSGDAGSVRLDANRLELIGSNTQIESSTFAQGDAGNIALSRLQFLLMSNSQYKIVAELQPVAILVANLVL